MSAAGARGLRAGLRAAVPIVPTFLGIFTSFGILAHVAGVPPWAALLMTIAVFAAPAQFAMIDAAGMWQMIAAGILVNLRFFPMSLALSQLVHAPRWRKLLMAQFLIATSYLLTFFAARRRPRSELPAFFLGVASMAFPAAVAGTTLGLVFGIGLPALLAFGATLFLPIYFSLLLAGELKARYEVAAALLGFALTPFAEYAVPGWGVFLAALGVGALVTAVER